MGRIMLISMIDVKEGRGVATIYVANLLFNTPIDKKPGEEKSQRE